jgi:ferritin-like metal-binding protein YciE
MALFSGNIEDLKTLYTTQLRFLLSTEQQIIKALPKMIEAATEPQLKQALQTHLQETEIQEERLEEILAELTGETDEKKCATTAALLSAGETIIKDTKDDSTRDAGIIASAQKVEHFEMASYGAVRNWAMVLGYAQHAEMLNKTLQEEGHADKVLTSISDRANAEASAAA